MNKRLVFRWLVLLGCLLPVCLYATGGDIPAVVLKEGAKGAKEYSLNLKLLMIMTSLTFLPAFLMMMTAFIRIVIVMGMTRQALGMPTTPSNQIIVGLALFLTFFIMSPIFDKINTNAVQPLLKDKIDFVTAVDRAQVPLRKFMLHQTREGDLDLFMRLSKTPAVDDIHDVPFMVLVPAYVTSELKTAFQIGFLIFLPFLVIDIVIASVLMSMGMMMLSPMVISLPFKIMLFVLVDGWTLVVGSLSASFGL